MSLVDVGAQHDFADGEIRPVEADGKDVGVVRWAASWYALRNVCPHLGAPLCKGPLQPLVAAGESLNTLVADRERPVLMCPWHRWEFDLGSGRALASDDKIRVYPVHVRDGRVLVEV